MSCDTKGIIITKTKDLDLISRRLLAAATAVQAEERKYDAHIERKIGQKHLRVCFQDGEDNRILWVFSDCDCDYPELGKEKIILSLGCWGNSVALMKRFLRSLGDLGECYLWENDCGDPAIPFPKLKATILEQSEEEYKKEIFSIADYLCGWSCGYAADGIIEYCKRPDISRAQVERILRSLN